MYASKLVFSSPVAPNSRSSRTACRIQEEFRSLLSNRPFDDISAAELADRCGIARSTLYRHFATTAEILWATARPLLKAALRAALSGEAAEFAAEADRLWTVPGAVPALAGLAGPELKGKFAVLCAAEVERATGRKDATMLGVVIAGAWFEFVQIRAFDRPTGQDLAELMTITFVSAFLTPEALRARARQHLTRHTFPAAVSARESIASREHILSMIDGKPYRSLTRHIARFGMTPDAYRACFGLDEDYPMVAPAYSDRRRAIARSWPAAAKRRGRASTPAPRAS